MKRTGTLAAAFLVGLLLAPAALADGPAPGAAKAVPYLLGPQDRLRLRVVAWKPVEGAAEDWSALSGEYLVGPDGTVSVPFLGRLEAEGRSASQLGERIAPLLQSALGLADPPGVALEVVEYRPVFVSGDVREPGMYPFRPGMSVLQAVTVAGGPRFAAAGDDDGSGRAFIQAVGRLSEADAERAGLLARLARLRAEEAGAAAIAFPSALEAPAFAQARAGETALLTARRDRLERQRTGLEQLQDLLRKELAAFETKLAVQAEQRDAVRKELAGLEQLKRKGLAPANRVRGVSQTLAQIETNILNIESERLRALQDLNRAERDLVALEGERTAEVATLLQQTEAALVLNDRQRDTYRALAAEARATGSAAPVAGPVAGPVPVPRYRITRQRHEGTGGAQSLPVARTAPVRPGDVIEVRLVLPAPAEVASQ